MRPFTITAVLCLAFFWIALSLLAQEPTDREIAQWTDQLSDDSYIVRQAAAEHLFAAGTAARVALLELAAGPDPETRAAARRLVTKIDQSAFERRLAAFAADGNGHRGLTLPGWKTFRLAMGGDSLKNDSEARSLFVAMHRQEADLLDRLFSKDRAMENSAWEDRLLRLLNWRVHTTNRAVLIRPHNLAPPLGSCATMLFLGTMPELKISDRATTSLAHLASRSPIREAIKSGRHRQAIRKLVSSWVTDCPNKNEPLLLQRLQLVQAYELRDALPWVAQVLQSTEASGSASARTRASAILILGKLGNPEHADFLKPLLEDKRVCQQVRGATPQKKVLSVQVRDVALAVMIHLAGKDVKDFGYLHARPNQQSVFILGTLHFAGDAQRDQALAKWRQWKSSR